MISVVFSTKNGASRLTRTLNSLSEQNFNESWELIIVDNGSTDNSKEIIEQYKNELPIKLLSELKPGKNIALNLAIEYVSGDLIVFTDDDIRAERDWLQNIQLVAEKNPNFDIFGGAIAGEWEIQPEQWILDWAPTGALYAIKDMDNDGPCEPGKIWGPNMFVRKHVFTEGKNKFNERIGPNGTPHYPMGSETEFTKRMYKLGFKTYFSNQFKVHHWISASSLSREWILNRGYRLGKGVTLTKFEQNEKINPLPLIMNATLFNLLSVVGSFCFKPKQVFWNAYKAKYYRGTLRGVIRGYTGW